MFEPTAQGKRLGVTVDSYGINRPCMRETARRASGWKKRYSLASNMKREVQWSLATPRSVYPETYFMRRETVCLASLCSRVDRRIESSNALRMKALGKPRAHVKKTACIENGCSRGDRRIEQQSIVSEEVRIKYRAAPLIHEVATECVHRGCSSHQRRENETTETAVIV